MLAPATEAEVAAAAVEVRLGSHTRTHARAHPRPMEAPILGALLPTETDRIAGSGRPTGGSADRLCVAPSVQCGDAAPKPPSAKPPSAMLRRRCVVLRRDVSSLVSRMVPQRAQHGSETDGDSDADADAGADAGADACGSSGQHRPRGSDEQDPVIGLLSLAQVRACMPWQARAQAFARVRVDMRAVYGRLLLLSWTRSSPCCRRWRRRPRTPPPPRRAKALGRNACPRGSSATPTAIRLRARGGSLPGRMPPPRKRGELSLDPRRPDARVSLLRAPSGALASSRADARTRSSASSSMRLVAQRCCADCTCARV
jgi:hypothetical protein